jgi:hypothetical protein
MRALAARADVEWAPGQDRSVAMDTYGMQASYHMFAPPDNLAGVAGVFVGALAQHGSSRRPRSGG